MPHERTQGFQYSAIGHVLLIALIAFGAPELFTREAPVEPHAISVEILPVTGVTNVKPSRPKPKKETPKEEPKKDEPKSEEVKPEPPQQKTAEKPRPKVVTKELPPPPKPEPKPEKTTKPIEKPKEKEDTPEKKEQPKEPDDLMAVLKSVKQEATEEQDKKDNERKKPRFNEESDSRAESDIYDPNKEMSMSEKDAIRSQIERCWSVLAGARDAHDLIVYLYIELNKDGSLISVDLADKSKGRYYSDSFYKAAADSAMRAVKMCSPIQHLPAHKYHSWKSIELAFDPKNMLY